MNCVDSPCELEGLVVIIEIVLVFGGQKDASEHHLVNVAVVEDEAGLTQVIAVNVDDSHDEASGRELCVLVQPSYEVSHLHVRHGLRVEDRVAGTVVLHEIVKQTSNQCY